MESLFPARPSQKGEKMSKVHIIKYGISAIVALSLLIALPTRAGDGDQARLDAACEAAREKSLAPLRAGFIEECVEKKQRTDRAACERFYADFGNQSGNRAALFYDLPECVTAFENRRN
jgi:hypothetical protein